MTGIYTDIVDIVAPDSAKAGETVPVTIWIKNKYSASVHVAAIGVLDAEESFIDWLDYWIPAGATHSFSGTFVMPARDVTIHAYSYYEAEDGDWYFDDAAEKAVSLEEVEVFVGTISKKELEHDSARASIPAYDISQGERGLVHITGRNDMSTTQRLGIHWLVYDPDGILVEDYEDWSTLYYRQGAEHEFIGGRFNLNKPGTYTINIALSMNPADPEIVDSYYGTLCTVAVAEEFAGTISRKELEYDASRAGIPVY